MTHASYKHIDANIFNFTKWIDEVNPEILKDTFSKHLKQSEFTILQFSEHYFDLKGYTCFWLLAESHLAIHTFPESNTTYIELSSCNNDKLNTFKSLL